MIFIERLEKLSAAGIQRLAQEHFGKRDGLWLEAVKLLRVKDDSFKKQVFPVILRVKVRNRESLPALILKWSLTVKYFQSRRRRGRCSFCKLCKILFI